MSSIISRETSSVERSHFTWKVDNFARIRNSWQALQETCFYFKMGNQIGLTSEYLICLTNEEHNACGKTWTNLVVKLIKKPSDVEEIEMSTDLQKKNFKIIKCEGPCSNYELETSFNIAEHRLGVVEPFVSDDVAIGDLPLTEDGALVLEITVELHSPKRNLDVTPELLKSTKKKFIRKLQSDFSSMLLEKADSRQAVNPTQIICKNGVFLPANRNLICARSPVLKRMFQGDTLHARNGLVQAKEISSSTIKELLHFLYTGILLENWSHAGIVEELVYAAGKYELVDLLELFDQVLGLICTKENAGLLISLAKQTNLKKAYGDLFVFIKNHSTSFVEMENFVDQSRNSNLVIRSVIGTVCGNESDDSFTMSPTKTQKRKCGGVNQAARRKSSK